MAKTPLPSPDVLRQLLRYEPETGRLFWKERDIKWFADGGYSAQRRMAVWNSAFSNKEAFTSFHRKGYKKGQIFEKQYLAHRVIWVIAHGAWPRQIDHINGDPADNRLTNLRSVTSQENQQNMSRARNNTSGCTGVTWDQAREKWIAQIQNGGRNVHLGRFSDRDEAICARKVAEAKYGFHANHGR